MFKVHVRKNDTVLVLSGKDAGKRGKVLEVDRGQGKVLVEGVNVVRRHLKPRPPRFPQGGIVEKALPIPSSRVMLVCPKCSKPTRIAKKVKDDGTRTRVCKHCKEEI
jgi:large subunit ribosomal protein L24